MNSIRINLNVSNFNGLVSSGGLYPFIIDFLKADGTALNNSNVPNTLTLNVAPTGNGFQLNIPISSGTYSIPGVKIKIYNLNRSSCCYTESSYTINNNEGGTIPPPIETDPGPVNFKLIVKGMDEHMRLTRRTDGDLDYITDNTANSLNSGYEYRYVIGAQVIKRSTPLNEYPVARNLGYRVLKFNTKIGLDTLNRWPGQGEPGDGGYYDSNAGQGFVYNVSAAIESGVFSGSQSGFKNFVPANYNPGLAMPQWADIAPDLKLPSDHVFVLRRGDWSIAQVMAKGMTHISHFELPRPGGDESQAVAYKLQGITYNDVPNSFMIFGNPLPVNPTDQQVDAMIDRYNLTDAIWINETMEQEHALPPESGWLRRFYAGIRAIHQRLFTDKGLVSYICHNYFQFWPNTYHLGQVPASESKENFRRPLSELTHTNFSPGGSLSNTNLIVEAVYLGAPDLQQNKIYDLAYKLKLFKRMGYESGVFLAGEHEWRPNNMFLNEFPDGKYYSKGKMPLDPNTLMSCVIWSQIYAKVFVQWGGSGKVSARIFDRFTFEPTYWKANGSTEYKTSSANPNWNGGSNGDVFPYQSHPDFPHMVSRGIGYYGYNGGVDLSRFALQMYAETWGQIDPSGTRRYLSFKLDDGPWIEALNLDEDDLINAATEKRGFVDSINKDGRIAWHYTNGYADNVWHTLAVRFPNGRVVTNRVAGNGTHIKIENL